MKNIFLLLTMLTLISCSESEPFKFDPDEVSRVEVFQEDLGEKVSMLPDFQNTFLQDLSIATKTEPIQFAKTYRIEIEYKDGKIETILSNGIFHQKEGCYSSQENLIEKYKID